MCIKNVNVYNGNVMARMGLGLGVVHGVEAAHRLS